MGNIDAAYPTPSAVRLHGLARQIASACPGRLGEEIALIGSVASGWADELSDLELVLFVAKVPDLDAVAAWAKELAVESITLREKGGLHLIGLYEGVWLELQWRTFEETDRLIDTVMNIETTSRQALVSVDTIARAVPLRTSGSIAGWQDLLSVYPERLTGRIVAESSEFWRAPHHIETLWALADRGHMFSLVEWLQADIQDALRLLFAANRRWEPDWKWLRHHLDRIGLVPDRLSERIGSVFARSDPHKAVAEALDVIEDILVLIEPDFDVSPQLRNIRRARHHASAPSERTEDTP